MTDPNSTFALRRLEATRYVTALREGGSLPAILDTTDGLFVAKFRGAGQGVRALVAEIIVGEVARAAGLNMPEVALLELDAGLARTERDEEVGDLLKASEGLNVGLRYLSGALMFDAAAGEVVDGEAASRIVMLDAWAMNVDRTARNPNLMWCEAGLWLIDHGAALYWHHGFSGSVERPDRPFPQVRDHVLLPAADALAPAAAVLQAALTDAVIERAVHAVPEPWRQSPTADDYVQFLTRRRDALPALAQEADDARRRL